MRRHEDTVTLRLHHEAFDDLLESDPAFRQGVFVALAHELRRATSHLGELHFLDLCGRIASRLAQMALSTESTADGEVRLPGRRSQTELASMVGGSRQRVNVHLGELVDDGMIRLEGREIVIIDRAALERRGQW
jgi:CRP-like cAMP-binding protein